MIESRERETEKRETEKREREREREWGRDGGMEGWRDGWREGRREGETWRQVPKAVELYRSQYIVLCGRSVKDGFMFQCFTSFENIFWFVDQLLFLFNCVRTLLGSKEWRIYCSAYLHSVGLEKDLPLCSIDQPSPISTVQVRWYLQAAIWFCKGDISVWFHVFFGTWPESTNSSWLGGKSSWSGLNIETWYQERRKSKTI